MARFLKDSDYSAIIRNEIKNALREAYTDNVVLLRQEEMAIAQIRNYLAGRYDVDSIFTPVEDGATDTRNAHIVMITIDCVLYHLYTAEAPDRIPDKVNNRYQDALTWLRDVTQTSGDRKADLPLKKNDEGEVKTGFSLKSRKPNNYKW